jgi:hypothetical protein
MSKIIKKVISEVYNTNLTNTKYEFLSDFTFLWGVFENRFRQSENDSLNLKRISDVLGKPVFDFLKYNIHDFSSLPEFICYKLEKTNLIISLPEIQYNVSLFPIYRDNEFKCITKIFDSDSGVIEKFDSRMILLLCFVTYRLRNNLFHGNKQCNELMEQEKLFNIINNFICELLIKTKTIERI